MARKTHLVVGTLTLGTGTYTKNFENCRLMLEDEVTEGRGVGERYQDEVIVGSRATFSASVFRTVGGARQTNLTASVFSFGGTSYLGRMKSYTLTGTTVSDEGSGHADRWEYDFATGTNLQLSGTLQVATVAELMALQAGAISAKGVQVILASGGTRVTAPMQLRSASHNIDVERIQMEDVQFGMKGSTGLAVAAVAPAVNPDPIIASLLTGTASVAWSFDSGANVYTSADGALIQSFEIQGADNAIIRDMFEFKVQGEIQIS